MVHDTSGPFTETLRKNKYWIQMVDDCTGLGLCSFTPTKDKIGKHFETWLITLKGQGFDPKYLRCDPAGENRKHLKEVCMKYGIILEMTATGTPQQNGKVERRFAVLKARAKACLTAANLSATAKTRLWAEAVHTVNTLYNLCSNSKGAPPYTKMHQQISPLYPHLQPFGRIGYIMEKQTIRGQWRPKRTKCLMMGYAPLQASGTYKVYKPSTNEVVASRNITWAPWTPMQPEDDLEEIDAAGNDGSVFPHALHSDKPKDQVKGRRMTVFDQVEVASPRPPIKGTIQTSQERQTERQEPAIPTTVVIGEESIESESSVGNGTAAVSAQQKTTYKRQQAHEENQNESNEEKRRKRQNKGTITWARNIIREQDKQKEELQEMEEQYQGVEEHKSEESEESKNEEHEIRIREEVNKKRIEEEATVVTNDTGTHVNTYQDEREEADEEITEFQKESVSEDSQAEELEVITKLDKRVKNVLKNLESNLKETLSDRGEGTGNVRVTRSQVKIPTRITRGSKKKQISEAHLVMAVQVNSDPLEPGTFRKAMDGKDGHHWFPSAIREALNFVKRGAWQIRPKSEPISQGRREIPCKWIFKRKSTPDLIKSFKSRIVVKGYMQIPGVDYTETFSPVASDTAIRLGISIVLYFQENSAEDWVLESIDIEAAFLEADLNKPVYVQWPEGLVELGIISAQEERETCIMLNKAMYGTVDAPLRFYRTLQKTLTSAPLNLQQCKSEPTMFYKSDSEGNLRLVIITFVDDIMVGGPKTEVEWFKQKIQERFKITEEGRLAKHLGIKYQWGNDESGLFVEASMTDMVEDIITSYVEKTGKEVKEFHTPGAPGTSLTKNEDATHRKKDYMSLVGKLMYLTTKLSLETSNAVRELAKHLINPGPKHWKALERLVGYLKWRKNDIKITYRPPRELRVVSYVDSNYGHNKEDRRSISGAIHTLGGSLLSFQSKTQGSITLSSTEAEYIALSMGLQEVRYVQQILKELTGQERTAWILEDNQGAIFLVKNPQIGARSKHIDIRHHYIRECYQKKQVNLIYEDTKLNHSDILTKHTQEGVHLGHTKRITTGTMRVWTEYDQIKTVAEVLMTLLEYHKEGGCWDESKLEVLCSAPTGLRHEGESKIKGQMSEGEKVDPEEGVVRLDP